MEIYFESNEHFNIGDTVIVLQNIECRPTVVTTGRVISVEDSIIGIKLNGNNYISDYTFYIVKVSNMTEVDSNTIKSIIDR